MVVSRQLSSSFHTPYQQVREQCHNSVIVCRHKHQTTIQTITHLNDIKLTILIEHGLYLNKISLHRLF